MNIDLSQSLSIGEFNCRDAKELRNGVFVYKQYSTGEIVILGTVYVDAIVLHRNSGWDQEMYYRKEIMRLTPAQEQVVRNNGWFHVEYINDSNLEPIDQVGIQLYKTCPYERVIGKYRGKLCNRTLKHGSIYCSVCSNKAGCPYSYIVKYDPDEDVYHDPHTKFIFTQRNGRIIVIGCSEQIYGFIGSDFVKYPKQSTIYELTDKQIEIVSKCGWDYSPINLFSNIKPALKL